MPIHCVGLSNESKKPAQRMELKRIFSENALPLSIVEEKKKVRENTIHYVLNVESLQYQEQLSLLLKDYGDYQIEEKNYRFPLEGMASPPPMVTLFIIQTLPSPEETSNSRLLSYYLILTIIIVAVGNYYEKEFFGDDAKIATLVMGLFSVLHILFNVLRRDLKKIN